jgi:hypothetical protein
MKLKNGANRVMIWRNQTDITLVLAKDTAEVYRQTLAINPRSITEAIWIAAADHLTELSRSARRAAAQPCVLQPLMLRDTDVSGASPCRVLIPFGAKGEYRLEIASNLYPLPEASRCRSLALLADEIASCAQIAWSHGQPDSVWALHPAA